MNSMSARPAQMMGQQMSQATRPQTLMGQASMPMMSQDMSASIVP